MGVGGGGLGGHVRVLLRLRELRYGVKEYRASGGMKTESSFSPLPCFADISYLRDTCLAFHHNASFPQHYNPCIITMFGAAEVAEI